jgi:putative two-component system response regulator
MPDKIDTIGMDLGELETPEERLNSVSNVSPLMKPLLTSILPILVIDKDLKIVATNPVCDKLFPDYVLYGNYFFDVFGKFFHINDVISIRDSVVAGNNGYSWKGLAMIKSRNRVTTQVRIYIFPLELDISKHSDFVVMFDDVTAESRQLLRTVFLSLLEASKLKDNDTGMHINRVNLYSKRLAQELFIVGNPAFKNIDADFVDNIGFLASMHDVGKVGTPDDILNKEGPLSDWEWTVMREHTKNGAFILSTYPNPMAKEIALSHHEKWNGSGYPFQLERDMIPLSARIVAIADVYDALRMPRSYKPAFSHQTAMEKIMEISGIHFDTRIVEIFERISQDFEAIYDKYEDRV